MKLFHAETPPMSVMILTAHELAEIVAEGSGFYAYLTHTVTEDRVYVDINLSEDQEFTGPVKTNLRIDHVAQATLTGESYRLLNKGLFTSFEVHPSGLSLLIMLVGTEKVTEEEVLTEVKRRAELMESQS